MPSQLSWLELCEKHVKVWKSFKLQIIGRVTVQQSLRIIRLFAVDAEFCWQHKANDTEKEIKGKKKQWLDTNNLS